MKETKQQTNSNLISGNIDYRRLDDCTFFRRLGFELSDEQKKLRDAIFNPNIDIVFVDAPAGPGCRR